MRRVVPLLATAALALAAQELKFAGLGDFRLESGDVIRDCRIGYRTFGRLDEARSNAVLFPTWFTGRTADLVQHIGPGKLVDPSRFFVIAIDALGDGVSSSPSNSKAQPRMRFPKFTIRDMVNSQRAALMNTLGIRHLRAVIGISMGGMQTFQWMVSYPDFMDRAIPIVGTPQLTSQDLLLWNAELRAIRLDPNWHDGNYASIPEAGMRLAADIHVMNLTTPARRVGETSRIAFPSYIAAYERDTARSFDANDWIRQLQAMLAHHVAGGGTLEGAAQKVRAKTLIIVADQDHMVRPEPAVHFGEILGLPVLKLKGDCGHLATACEAAATNAAVGRFLED